MPNDNRLLDLTTLLEVQKQLKAADTWEDLKEWLAEQIAKHSGRTPA